MPAAVSIIVGLYVLNWLSADYFGFPFLWCWGSRFAPVIQPLLLLTKGLAFSLLVFMCLKRDPVGVASSLMVCLIAFGIPEFADIALRLGKTCPSGLAATKEIPMYGGIP